MHGVQQRDQELVGEAAATLPWLCPSADALIQLAGDPVPVADLSTDIGLVLLALRYVRSAATLEGFSFASLRESVVAEAASKLLVNHTRDWLDPARRAARQLTKFSHQLSDTARRIADEVGTVSPDAAAAVGLIAPLGLWAVATVRADALPSGVDDSRHPRDPSAAQRKAWGLSHEEIARRLCSRWRLPSWVAACVTTLSLSVADAVRCGADPDLTLILRTAIEGLEDQQSYAGWLKTPLNGLRVQDQVDSPDATPDTMSEDPRTVRLLPQLLRAAARGRRSNNESRLRTTEEEVDRLHRLLADLRDGFEVAVRDAKLSGLAELAAGAGHEINNPLAVISGNAQRLKKTETDDGRRKALDAIIRQSSRISEIVRELMQYARPAGPNRSVVDLAELVSVTAAEFQPQASVKGIRLASVIECAFPKCLLDHGQTRKTLNVLVQNAIDATPNGGDIRIVLNVDSERVVIGVEDSGPGPSEAAVPHLFDPFYSGRSAGRGRGLGLATAWRLANLNGGELRYRHNSDGPTRFELAFSTLDSAVPDLRKPA